MIGLKCQKVDQLYAYAPAWRIQSQHWFKGTAGLEGFTSDPELLTTWASPNSELE